MVTYEEILNIANLSKLSVSEDELENLTKEMANIIAFADTINKAGDISSDFDNINNLTNAFHEDIVIPSFEREEILQNALDAEDGFFLVKKRK